MEAYIYQPLGSTDAIRIFELEPAKNNEAPFRGSFLIATLNNLPQFEALSYVWGEPSFTCNIEINGVQLPITPKLACALGRLRSAERPRCLWIDAICINQNDLIERGQQVARMPDIYRKAQTTLAWLGDSDESTSRTVQQLEQIAGSFPELSRLTNNNSIDQFEASDKAQKVIDMAAEAELEVFYQNAWFTRLWIVQEAVLAASVMFYLGEAQLNWETFKSATNIISTSARLAGRRFAVGNALDLILMRLDRKVYAPPEELPDSIQVDPTSTMTVQLSVITGHQEAVQAGTIERPKTGTTFQAMRDQTYMYNVWSLRFRHCFDDRDRIYATRGFIPWDIPISIMPDYSKSVPEIYTQFAKEMLRINVVEVLQLAGLWRRKLEKEDYVSSAVDSSSCPSWVSELRTPKLAGFRDNLWEHPLQPLELVKGFRTIEHPKISWPEDPTNWRQVTIQGLNVDEVIRVGKFDSYVEAMPLIENLKFLLNIYCETMKSPEMAERHMSIEDFAALIGLTSERDPDDGTRFVSLLCDGEATMAHMAEVTRGIEVLDPVTHPEEFKMDALVQFLVTRLSNRAFFSTSGGYIGFTPEIVETGDRLVRFRGLAFPFILRPISGTKDFQLIGQCYVHGEMRTEIQFDWGESEVEFEWFSLI